ncbi:MAG: amidase family protein, partial [Pseudomonadota bacterium]
MTNIFKDATILAGDIAAGTLDAADLMEETYAQIAAVNGEVNAIHALLPLEEAVAQAREASGPLGGLPLAVKDLANAAGFPTTMGSPIFASDAPAAADDLFIKRLRDAGAVVIGKTNTPEFGLGSHSTNPVHGVTRNPWDLSRTAGGSSGG